MKMVQGNKDQKWISESNEIANKYDIDLDGLSNLESLIKTVLQTSENFNSYVNISPLTKYMAFDLKKSIEEKVGYKLDTGAIKNLWYQEQANLRALAFNFITSFGYYIKLTDLLQVFMAMDEQDHEKNITNKNYRNEKSKRRVRQNAR